MCPAETENSCHPDAWRDLEGHWPCMALKVSPAGRNDKNVLALIMYTVHFENE